MGLNCIFKFQGTVECKRHKGLRVIHYQDTRKD